MIIHVCIPPQDIFSEDRRILHDFLHKLFDIYKSASHKLIVERDLIDTLIQNIELGADGRNILERLHRSYTTSAGIVDSGFPYISIFHWEDVSEVTLSGYSIGVRAFNKMNIHREARFVLENASTDGPIIDLFIKIAFSDRQAGRPAFEFVNGSGSGLPEEFARQLSQGYIVVGLFDSDRRFPGDQESEKVSKCRRELSSSSTKLGYFLELPCHEIENMIPYEVIAETIPNSVDKIETLKNIDNIEDNNSIALSQRFKMFFDYKNGSSTISGDTVKGKRAATFAMEKFHSVGMDISGSPFPGFGPAVISVIGKTGEAMGILHREVRRCKYWKSVYMEEMSKFIPYLIGGSASQAL